MRGGHLYLDLNGIFKRIFKNMHEHIIFIHRAYRNGPYRDGSLQCMYKITILVIAYPPSTSYGTGNGSDNLAG